MKASAVAAVGGVSLVGAVGLLALLSGGRRAPVMVSLSGTARDEEAIARMLASENPSGSVALWLEQIWTQIRSAGRRSLWAQITAGMGYGPQTDGRPVATIEPPTRATRDYAGRFLAELPPSRLPGARRFFEPAQQDRAFAVAERARAKRARGEALTAQESRLLAYKSDAAGIRARWAAKGHRVVGVVDGVEFWT